MISLTPRGYSHARRWRAGKLACAVTTDPSQLRQLLPRLATWKLVLLAYLAFSCGQATFPSSGDQIGKLGGSR